MSGGSGGYCRVLARAVLGGRQETMVRAFGREDGWPQSFMSVRVGDIVVRIDDRTALEDLAGAITQAVDLANSIWILPAPRVVPLARAARRSAGAINSDRASSSGRKP